MIVAILGVCVKARLLESTRVRQGAQRRQAAIVHNEYGLPIKSTGEYERAREQYETALGIVRDAGDSEEAATILHNIAGIRFVLGDPAGAARSARRGLAMRRRLHDDDDDLTVLLDEATSPRFWSRWATTRRHRA